ncbi:hypothetical protein P153DRAFT_365809 [Dothidotthia symphoricarpi CBS 119687]|uniref:Uncharacterized protein n=1 Tax=Dothidotthia symphoricarpi CBS 119687 TaxID=1392245 RepID=A0A6A6AK15_9PLEO|nr:uncharacterized protein P153DRAFT_365809 [Dothidotthia symphoricarpi CBS 119687]KAF2131217.1 hypothetical protein P153DRAFT_365809 [Dothidotthia symphoricarpi CBS 119687]
MRLLPLVSLASSSLGSPLPNPITPKDQNRDDASASGMWSKADILALVAVCVAVLGLITTLAWPKLSQWLRIPFRYCRSSPTATTFDLDIWSDGERRRRRLQEDYSAWLEFNDWVELRSVRR